jgi:flagellar motor switch protein FliM
MSDVLSQDEVDALLKAVGDGTVPPPGVAQVAQSGKGGVRGIDLTNQERSLGGRLPGLEVVLGRLQRDLRSSLATFFGHVPNVTVQTCELVKFGGFMERLQHPVGLQFFRLTPLRGQGMLVLRAPLLAAVLQVMFGGTLGRKSPAATREFSAIEQRVLERIGTRVLVDLKEAWRPVAPLECAYLRTETNPLFANICAAHELVLHVELLIGVEGLGDLSLSMCMPNGSLDPIRADLSRTQELETSEDGEQDVTWHERMRAALAEAPVELSVELGMRAMSMREVLALNVGDLVAFNTGREGPVLVRVAGRPHFLGAPGISGSNNAVRVTTRL